MVQPVIPNIDSPRHSIAPLGHLGQWRTVLTACAIATAVLAPILGLLGSFELIIAAIVSLTLVVTIAARPELGAYLYILATPLIVGIARGSILPILRPNEALVALILCGLGLRIAFNALNGKPFRPILDRVDLAFIAMAVSASVLPLAFRFGRDEPITLDDLLYASVLWKYYVVYRFFRESITTSEQVRVCLWLSMCSASLVAVIALLQVSNLLGVPNLLFAYFDNPFQATARVITERGTSTIASSFGVADTMMMNLSIAMVMLSQIQGHRFLLAGLGGLFLLGCIAAGQFSGLVGLGLTALVIGILIGRLLHVVALAVPVGTAAAAFLWPVIAERLKGFDSLSGLPSSWVNRIENLERFFWPDLWSGLNWLTGVRPAARVATPEPWREWAYIESGYLWLLWSGGLIYLSAFVLFAFTAGFSLRSIIRNVAGAQRVAACACLAWLITMGVLMIFDPHLTMRGAADLFFPLLALSCLAVQSEHSACAISAENSHEAWLSRTIHR